MTNGQTTKNIETFRADLQTKIPVQERFYKKFIWSSRHKKFFLHFALSKDPLRVLQLPCQSLSVPIKLSSLIEDILLSKKQDFLFILDKTQFLYLFDVCKNQIFKKIRLKSDYVESLVLSTPDSQGLIMNSPGEGFYYLNTKTTKIKEHAISGYGYPTSENFLSCPQHRILHTNLENEYEATLSLHRNLKLNVYPKKHLEYENTAKALRKDGGLLLSGDIEGKMHFINTRNKKIVKSFSLESNDTVNFLKFHQNLFYGSVEENRLLIWQTFYPHSLLFSSNLEHPVSSICFINQHFLIGSFKHNFIYVYKLSQIDRQKKEIKKRTFDFTTDFLNKS